MREERPENNPESNTGPVDQRPGSRDFREERRENRRERRERMERDPLRGLLPGLILILLGILLFLATQGSLPWDIWWQYLLIGLGAVFIFDGLAHYLNPSYRDTAFGRFIPGVILLFVGIAFVYGFGRWWPLVLIAAGIIVLINLLLRRKT